jgi:hypothetical protein
MCKVQQHTNLNLQIILHFFDFASQGGLILNILLGLK